jgi:hypothetical protein
MVWKSLRNSRTPDPRITFPSRWLRTKQHNVIYVFSNSNYRGWKRRRIKSWRHLTRKLSIFVYVYKKSSHILSILFFEMDKLKKKNLISVFDSSMYFYLSFIRTDLDLSCHYDNCRDMTIWNFVKKRPTLSFWNSKVRISLNFQTIQFGIDLNKR